MIELARDEDQHLMLLHVTGDFFRQVCDGKIKHHGRPITLFDACDDPQF